MTAQRLLGESSERADSVGNLPLKGCIRSTMLSSFASFLFRFNIIRIHPYFLIMSALSPRINLESLIMLELSCSILRIEPPFCNECTCAVLL